MFEAMAMGLPIIFCGPPGEAQQTIDAVQAGICCDSDRPQYLCDAINSLVSNEALRNKYAALSLKSSPQFSREQQARKFIDELVQELDQKPNKTVSSIDLFNDRSP
jgi:glycosyltransferase involved in cell wall biosynthesis